MHQTPSTARETLWTYQGTSEEKVERDFFAALGPEVAEEIRRHLQNGNGRVWVGREVHLRIGSYTLQARLTNIEPLLASEVEPATQIITRYRDRAPDEGQDLSSFVSEIIRYPDAQQKALYDSLIGLDEIKLSLFRKITLLIGPHYIDEWLKQSYPEEEPRLIHQALHNRYPLLILEGEVGSGKTALARSIGHALATSLQTGLVLFVVNAQVRGGGHVGELTQNISRAFAEAERCQTREQIPVLLLIDEADALAQTRGKAQTHHEDDAGVNALIQCIDRLRGRPMAVLFATNLVQTLDAAILRRAGAVYHFDRPQRETRIQLLSSLLTPVGISENEIATLADLTEPCALHGFGELLHRYTCSDLTQRIIPRAVEEALYARQPLSMEHLMWACRETLPTPEMTRTGLDEEQTQDARQRSARDKKSPLRMGRRFYRPVEE